MIFFASSTMRTMSSPVRFATVKVSDGLPLVREIDCRSRV